MAPRPLLLLVLSTGCFSGPQRVATLGPVAAPGHLRLHIEANDASVRVYTADVAQVELRVLSKGYDPQRDFQVSMVPSGDRVDIVAKVREDWHWFDFAGRSLRLEVRTPRNVDVEVSSGDGSVEVDPIAGNLDIRTGDGHVVARGARGNIRLHTGDGSIQVQDLDGNIRLHTGDGSIQAQDLSGNLDATTDDGSVRVSGRFDALAIQTGDGKLVASAFPGSRMTRPWHLETGDGSITLAVPPDLAARIDASTDDGSVRSSLPLQQVGDSHAIGDINGGGPPIVVRSGDGSIRLSQL